MIRVMVESEQDGGCGWSVQLRLSEPNNFSTSKFRKVHFHSRCLCIKSHERAVHIFVSSSRTIFWLG